MRRLYLILILILLATTLAGCAAITESQRAATAKAQAKAAEASARAQIAQAAANETQAIQATAQVAQVEATSRLMAFLATVTVISQSNMTIIAAGLIAVGLFVAAWIVGRNKR